MWIFGSVKKDFALLYLPAVLTAICVRFFQSPTNPLDTWLLLFALQGFFDAGHVYATAWRTFLNKTERKRTRVYVVAPVVIFIFVYAWVHFEFPGLLTFLAYNALFHNMRQLGGISKWYQKLNGASRVGSNRFLYLLCLLPLAILVLRAADDNSTVYLPSAFLKSLDPRWSNALQILYLMTIAGWIAYEIKIATRSRVEWSRVLSVGFPALIHGGTYLFGATVLQIILPTAIAHGVSYMALVGISAKRTSHSSWKPRKLYFGIAATCLLLGSGEYLLRQTVLSFASSPYALRAALMLTPTFAHYYFDTFLWKRSHPDGALIYSHDASATGSLSREQNAA